MELNLFKFDKIRIISNANEALVVGFHFLRVDPPDVCHRLINWEHKAKPSSQLTGSCLELFPDWMCHLMEKMALASKGGVFPAAAVTWQIRPLPPGLTAGVQWRVRNKRHNFLEVCSNCRC